MKKVVAFASSVTVLPLIFTITWLMTNKMLPIADASNFLATGVEIYQKFLNDGFYQGIHSIFFTRGWRPIAFPIITVPFLIFTKGNLLATYNYAVTMIIFLSIVYVYLFLRLRLDRVSAKISTSLICLLPSVQMVAFRFFAESLLLPFSIGAIYHLVKSDYLKNKKHTILFSTCVIGAALVRPVEAATSFIFPLSWYVFSAFKQNKLDLKKFLITTGIILLFIAIWYVPFYKETYEWVYQTSFGDVALSNSYARVALLDNFQFQILTQGLIATIVVSLLALFNSTLNRFKNVWQREFTYILLLAPISIIEVFFTIQNLPRKIAIAYTAFFMVTLMIGLGKGHTWRLRAGIVSGLLVFQFPIAMLIATNNDTPNNLFRYGMTGIEQPINIKSNPYDKLVDFMINEAKRYSFKSVSLAIGTMGDEPIDPFVFNTIVLAKNPGFSTAFSFFARFDKDTLAQMNTFDAIFIADHADKLLVTKGAAEHYRQQLDNEKSISDKTKDYFMYHYAANDLAKLGWKIGPCLNVDSLRKEPYRGCLLLKG